MSETMPHGPRKPESGFAFDDHACRLRNIGGVVRGTFPSSNIPIPYGPGCYPDV